MNLSQKRNQTGRRLLRIHAASRFENPLTTKKHGGGHTSNFATTHKGDYGNHRPSLLQPRVRLGSNVIRF